MNQVGINQTCTLALKHLKKIFEVLENVFQFLFTIFATVSSHCYLSLTNQLPLTLNYWNIGQQRIIQMHPSNQPKKGSIWWTHLKDSKEDLLIGTAFNAALRHNLFLQIEPMKDTDPEVRLRYKWKRWY